MQVEGRVGGVGDVSVRVGMYWWGEGTCWGGFTSQ